MQFHATPAIDVGVSYDSQLNVHSKGTGSAVAADGLAIGGNPVTIEPPPDSEAKCAPGGVEGNLKACVDLALPIVQLRLMVHAGQNHGQIGAGEITRLAR